MNSGIAILADALEGEDVGALFALMGDANMHLIVEVERRAKVAVVHGRHENAVVAMADGMARASGGVGVCTITSGPAITQIPTSLTAAARHGTPLVVIAGDTPSDQAFHFQEFDAGPLVASTGAVHFRVAEIDRLADTVRLAFFTARTRRIPVVVTVPANVQRRSPDWYDGYESSLDRLPQPQALQPDPAMLTDFAKALSEAERPVIIAGRGAVSSSAKDALLKLGEQIGALLGTTVRAKGYFRESPYDIDIVGAFASRAARDLLADADLILGVGAGLGYYTSQAGYLAPDAKILQIDNSIIGYHEGQYVADLYLKADATAAVTAISNALSGLAVRPGYRTDDVTSRLRPPVTPTASARGELLDPLLAMQALDRALTPESRVVIGGGHFWTFAVTELRHPNTGNFVLTHDFGVIGQALPVGIGVHCAAPCAPVVVVEGDGSLLMNIQELETVARHNLSMAICVINDGAYGAELHKLNAQGLDGSPAFFGRPDFAAIANAFGMAAVRLTDPEELTALLEQQRASQKPMLIDIQVTEKSISGPYRRLHFGKDE